MRHRRSHTAAVMVVAALAVVVCAKGTAFAAPVIFNLNPAASTFTLGGTFNGVPLAAQSPGSATVGYTGALNVDVDRSLGLLTFAGTTIHAGNQPLDQPPSAPSETAANYGLQTAGGANPQTLFAARSIALFASATNAPYNTAASPGSAVGFFVDGGTLYFGPSAVAAGSVDLNGTGGGDQITGPITLATQGDHEVQTNPIQAHLSPGTDDPNEVELTLSGQFVATRFVPEPGAAALLACCATAALMRRRRGDSLE
jgi:hypothetical protein